MVNHILLYAVNISVHSYSTDGGVGRAKIARYMNVTPKTAAKRIEELITSGLVKVDKVSASRGHGFKYLYNLTQSGLEYLNENWTQVHADFHAWQSQRLIDELENIKNPESTAKSKKQRRQEGAGQMEMFS